MDGEVVPGARHGPNVCLFGLSGWLPLDGFLDVALQRLRESQASAMGSIPIARSITSDDSVDLTRLKR
jgi:hypothetical protein